MQKILVVDGHKLHLRDGLRGTRPVVACSLVLDAGAPLRDYTLDRPMASADAAAQFVASADEAAARQIIEWMHCSAGSVIDAVNRVFSAPASKAATRYHQLERQRTR